MARAAHGHRSCGPFHRRACPGWAWSPFVRPVRLVRGCRLWRRLWAPPGWQWSRQSDGELPRGTASDADFPFVARRKSSSLAIPARQPFDINGYFRRVSQAVDPSPAQRDTPPTSEIPSRIPRHNTHMAGPPAQRDRPHPPHAARARHGGPGPAIDHRNRFRSSPRRSTSLPHPSWVGPTTARGYDKKTALSTSGGSTW
jgi:hypothetical protein